MTSGKGSKGTPRAEPARVEAKGQARLINWKARTVLLAQLEAEYVATRNPMAVWGAWRLCRDECEGFGLPIPTWIIAYLDGFAAHLRDWQERGPPADRLAEEVGNALGFKPVGKNLNPITDWRNRRQGEAWFGSFEHRVNGGASPSAAIKGVADEVNSTAATVRRRLDEFARCFGMTPLEIVRTRQRLRDEEEAALQEMERRIQARLAAILRGEPDPMASDEAD